MKHSLNGSLKVGLMVSLELLQELDALYPPRCPDPRDSEREVWMKAGERRMVDVLWAKFNEANENPLANV